MSWGSKNCFGLGGTTKENKLLQYERSVLAMCCNVWENMHSTFVFVVNSTVIVPCVSILLADLAIGAPGSAAVVVLR